MSMIAVVSSMLGYTPEVTIVNADGTDVTDKFTVTDLNDAALAAIDSNDATSIKVKVVAGEQATAGDYVLTLSVGGEKVVRNITVEAASTDDGE